MGPKHKGIFPRCSGARYPDLRVGLTIDLREQVERAWAAFNYWSSTSNATNPDNAWNVNFNNGNVNNDNKDNDNHVRAVRGCR